MTNTTYIQKIEMRELALRKAQGGGISADDNSNILYYKYNKKFGFVDVNGQPLTEANSVTIFYARKPLSDGTETISDSIEPIIDDRWDDYLVFRAAFELTGKPEFLAMAGDELRRLRTLQGAERDRVYYIPTNRDYD
jgi:hypothetical protein